MQLLLQIAASGISTPVFVISLLAAVIVLPFAIKAKPLRPWVEGHNKALLVLAVDFILFGNMMNVISLHQKGFGFTMLMAVLVAVALVLLIANVRMKGRNGNE